MSYILVITLAEAKNYLRIDDTLSDDDAQITRMINASLSYIERWTNTLVYERAVTYKMIDGCISVYDAPIVSVTTADVTRVDKTLHTNFNKGVDTIDLVLQVGITLPADVPAELKEVGFELIDLMYYASETGKSFKKDLSELSIDTLNKYRRFLI